MKKLFLISAVALAALASCAKNEVVPTPDEKISFSAPVVGVPTKTITNSELPVNGVYPTDEDFIVYANHSTGEFTGWNADNVYMNSVLCEYKGTVNGWEPNPVYYWPKNLNSYLTFAAYSPAQAKTDVGEANIAYGADGLTMNYFKPQASGSQYDLMYSERAYNKQGGHSNAEYDITTTENPYHYHGVDLKFQHALSSIVFKVLCEDHTTDQGSAMDANTKITLNSITLNNVAAWGNFKENVDETTPGTYEAEPTWTPMYDQIASYSVSTATDINQNVTNTATAVTGANALMLIPQPFAYTVDGDTKKLTVTVNYTITNPDGKTWPQSQTCDLDGFVYKDNGGTVINDNAWKIGKRYIYTINIGMTKIHLAPEVSAWEDITAGALI